MSLLSSRIWPSLILSCVFMTTVVVPLSAFLRFISVSRFRALRASRSAGGRLFFGFVIWLCFSKIFQPMVMLSLVLCALCQVKCIQQQCFFLKILLFYLNLATCLTLTSQHLSHLVYYLKMLSMITAIPLLPFFSLV